MKWKERFAIITTYKLLCGIFEINEYQMNWIL